MELKRRIDQGNGMVTVVAGECLYCHDLLFLKGATTGLTHAEAIILNPRLIFE